MHWKKGGQNQDLTWDRKG